MTCYSQHCSTSLAQAFDVMPNPSGMIQHRPFMQLHFFCICKEFVRRPVIRLGRILGHVHRQPLEWCPPYPPKKTSLLQCVESSLSRWSFICCSKLERVLTSELEVVASALNPKP